MNSTKSNLIKASAIFAMISGLSSMVSGFFEVFGMGYVGATLTGTGAYNGQNLQAIMIAIAVIEIVLGMCSLFGGILLLKSRKDASVVSLRRYKAGCTLVIIGGCGLGLQSILLYIAFATKGSTFEPEFNDQAIEDDVKPTSTSQPSESKNATEHQIKLLREMRDRGEISSEEFKEIMFDIIKNQK